MTCCGCRLLARLSGKQHQVIARCVLACTPFLKVSPLAQIVTSQKITKPLSCNESQIFAGNEILMNSYYLKKHLSLPEAAVQAAQKITSKILGIVSVKKRDINDPN